MLVNLCQNSLLKCSLIRGPIVFTCWFVILRKLKNNSTIKTPTKANHSLQNSNQSHLPNQETKFSKLVKQKEPLNIRKSLLSRPIVVSKTATKTEGAVSAGPTKPAKLKRPVDKVNTSSRPVQSSTLPDHSTPIKNQGNFRRRSVAVSPQRDSSKANDDDKIKHKRRSGIPHFGAMVSVYILHNENAFGEFVTRYTKICSKGGNYIL